MVRLLLENLHCGLALGLLQAITFAFQLVVAFRNCDLDFVPAIMFLRFFIPVALGTCKDLWFLDTEFKRHKCLVLVVGSLAIASQSSAFQKYSL